MSNHFSTAEIEGGSVKKSIGKKFMRMVQQVVKSAKITYSDIMWDMDPISEYYAT